MGLNRRQLLRAGLAVGTLSTAAAARVEADQPSIDRQDAPILIAQASGYDRQISGILVDCCQLAVEQYLFSLEDAAYDGTIRSLPGYAPEFDRYTQIASFRAAQINLSAMDAPEVAAKTIEAFKTEVAIGIKEVLFGYALTSETHHIIALRGTQTENEWLGNILASQVNFQTRAPQYGKVHRGFQTSQEKIITQIRKAVEQLNPALPCYITGHSLGGAVAILTAAELSLSNPALSPQIRVYTYASPRVGDPTFARFYNQQIPNTFRIVNLADTVPISPSETFRGNTFQHVGQEWSFLSQLGNVDSNHAIDTYKAALRKGVETNQARSYPTSAICS